MNQTLEIDEIQRILPQSYPFLMIDRIIDYKKGEYLTAVKNITGNEWCFQGDQPNTSHFPETLLIEAAAQAALAFNFLNEQSPINPIPKYLLAQFKSEFFTPVYIGEQLTSTIVGYRNLERQGFVDLKQVTDLKEVSEMRIFYGIRK